MGESEKEMKSGLMNLIVEMSNSGNDPTDVIRDVESEIAQKCLEKYGKELMQKLYNEATEKVVKKTTEVITEISGGLIEKVMEENGLPVSDEDFDWVLYVSLIVYVLKLQYMVSSSMIIDNTFEFKYIGPTNNKDELIEAAKSEELDDDDVLAKLIALKGDDEEEKKDKKDDEQIAGYV